MSLQYHFKMDDNREVMLSVISDNLTTKSADKVEFTSLFPVLRHNKLLSLKKAAVQDLASYANSCLNSSKCRLEGLLFVKEFTDQCNDEVFQAHAATWCKLLTATLASYDGWQTKELSCVVLVCVLRRLAGYPDLSHDAASAAIPHIIPTLLQADKWKLAAVKCASLCLKYFHGPCGPFKNKIESFLFAYLSSSGPETAEVIGECYSLLAQAGGGGNMGVKHSEAWSSHMSKVLTSWKKTLAVLFEADRNFEISVGEDKHGINMTQVPDSEPQRTFTLHRNFVTLATIANVMLRTEFRAPVQVPAMEILDTVCVVLSVSPKQLMLHPNHEKTLLCTVLPSLHKAALAVLASLIKLCGASLVIYNGTINKLFLQVLNYTMIQDDSSPYRDVRSQAYSTLTAWLEHCQALTNIGSVASQLVSHFVADLKPHQTLIKLTNTKIQVDLEVKTHKKKRKANLGDTSKLTLSGSRNVERDFAVTKGALEALRLVLMKAGSLVSPQFHKICQDVVINAILQVQSNISPPAPYNDARCRRGIYQALLALVLYPHPTWVPPTQLGLALFRKGMRDSESCVARICSEAVSLCQVVIHPRAPPLRCPVVPSATEPPCDDATNQEFARMLQFDGLTEEKTDENLEIRDTVQKEPQAGTSTYNDSMEVDGTNPDNQDHISVQDTEEDEVVISDDDKLTRLAAVITPKMEEVHDVYSGKAERGDENGHSDKGEKELSSIVIDSTSDEELGDNSRRATATLTSDDGAGPSYAPALEYGKRKKLEDSEEQQVKKIKPADDEDEVVTGEVAEMLATFVDAGPDSE